MSFSAFFIFEIQPCLRWYIYLPRLFLHIAVDFSSLFTNIYKLPSVFLSLHPILTLRTAVPSHLSRRTPLPFLDDLSPQFLAYKISIMAVRAQFENSNECVSLLSSIWVNRAN